MISRYYKSTATLPCSISPILMGGSLFTNFSISDFFFKIRERFFARENYLRLCCLRYFIFQIIERWFPWHLKVCVPSSNILAMASRLNTFYGFETPYVQSSRHVWIIEKVLRHIRYFWRGYDVIHVGILHHLAFVSKCKKNVTLNFHVECVFW